MMIAPRGRIVAINHIALCLILTVTARRVLYKAGLVYLNKKRQFLTRGGVKHLFAVMRMLNKFYTVYKCCFILRLKDFQEKLGFVCKIN